MFSKNFFSNNAQYATLVGSSATIEGDFSADGKVRIDGKIKGDVKINGDLITGDTTLILGNVTAYNIYLAGTIEGNVYCKDQLRLASTATLTGDVQVKGLTIDEGGKFQGICSMSTYEKAAPKNTKSVHADISDGSRLKKNPIINKPQVNNTIDSL